MGKLKEVLFERPTFMIIAAALSLIQATLDGTDVRPLISKAVDEAIPALA